jgi:tRNA A-37 threonylcarbamoyl transferase component Bud32
VPEVGQVFVSPSGDEYTVAQSLKSGGMGSVALVHDRAGEACALKTLDIELTDATALEAEARHLALVDHPNVIRYRDYGTDPMPFLVMDLAPDGDLADLLRAREQAGEHLAIERVVELATAALDGLDAIHAHLVHRDLKPQNMLFAGTDLKIGDFGLAKILEASTAEHTFKGWGTARYQPPESWSPEPGASAVAPYDLYSLGVILYELVTLRTPFVGDRDELRHQHLYVAPRPPSELRSGIPGALEAVILQLLAKDPAARGGSAANVRDQLRAIAEAGRPSGEGRADAPAVAGQIQQAVAAHLQARSAAEAARLEAQRQAAERAERFRAGASALFAVLDETAESVRPHFAPLELSYEEHGTRRHYRVKDLPRMLVFDVRAADPDPFRDPRAPGEVIGFGEMVVLESKGSNWSRGSRVLGGANIAIVTVDDTPWIPRLFLIELRNHALMREPMRDYEPFYLENDEIREQGRLLWGGVAHVFTPKLLPLTKGELQRWFAELALG